MADHETGPTYVIPADKVEEATQISTYPTLSHTELRYSPDGDMWYRTYPEVRSIENGPYVVVAESGLTGKIYSHPGKGTRVMQWNHVSDLDNALRAMNHIIEGMSETAKRDRAIEKKAGDLLDTLQADYPKLTDAKLAEMHAETLEFLRSVGITDDTKKRGEVGKAVERVREGSRGLDGNQRPNRLTSETQLASAYSIMHARVKRAKDAEKFVKIYTALWRERNTSENVIAELVSMYRPESLYVRTLLGTADPDGRLPYGQLLGMSRHAATFLLGIPKLKPYRPACRDVHPIANKVWDVFNNENLSELEKLALLRENPQVFEEIWSHLAPFVPSEKPRNQAAA